MTNEERKSRKILNGLLDKRTTHIHEDFWDRFVLLAKVCYYINEEADLFDVFDTMRTKLLGGWSYSGSQLDQLDAEIAREEPLLVGA